MAPREWSTMASSSCCPMSTLPLAQHVLPAPAGIVGTHSGPVLSAADSMRITVHGRGAHGSMPQAAVDPVVLAAMIVVRLQTVVSREVSPNELRCSPSAAFGPEPKAMSFPIPLSYS